MTKQQKEYIAQHFADKSATQLATELGLPRRTILTHVWRKGIKKKVVCYYKGQTWSKEIVEQLFYLQKKGLSVPEIATKINRTPWAVYAKLRQVKLKGLSRSHYTDTPAELGDITEGMSPVDIAVYFGDIDTDEMPDE